MIRTALTLLCVAGALSMAAPAAAGDVQYYTAPKLVTRGAPVSPIAGTGTVLVQVLVKPDGTFTVQKVIRSTNHADDAAALEIAKSSTYKPAVRGTKPELAFYDYTLVFKGSSVADADSPSAPAAGGGIAQYKAMLHAGNFNGAKTGLTGYLAAHPGDTQAEAALGAADTFLNDPADAVAAFDKAGAVPPQYKAVAAAGYAKFAQAQLHDAPAAAAAAAAKAAALAPSAATYNLLGTAQTSAGDAASGIVSLEKARGLAAGLPAPDRGQITQNLVYAYVASGNIAKAKAIVAEITATEPAVAGNAQTAIANYYAKQAEVALKSGKADDAAAAYESAAQAAPSLAVTMYAAAALAYLNSKPAPESGKAKAEADKALALDANDAHANYAEGVALAQDGKSRDALAYLDKADKAAKSASDTAFATTVENTIKQLRP